MSKAPGLSAILYGKPTSLAGRRNRAKRWGKSKNEHRLMCKRLSNGTPDQQAMVERAANCKRRRPCGEAWCPQCLRRAQERIIDHIGPDLQAILLALQEEAKSAGQRPPKSWAVSAVDESMAVKRRTLDAVKIKQKNYLIRSRVENSDLADAMIFLGWDVSLNLKKDRNDLSAKRKKNKTLWQPHLYGIVLAPTKDEVRRVLSPLFPKSAEKGKKPLKVMARTFEDITRTAKYALKPNFIRRAGYLGKNGRAQTAKNDLKANEAVELAVFLNELGFKDRLLLKGVKIVRGRLVRTSSYTHQNGPENGEDGPRSIQISHPGLFAPSR